ncbi:hypothetical protein SNK19_23855 [Ralstonia pseudosolanacearum]|uniref:hypothetical protein n=1 Tax=Ralstonia pseudosolanacearum TaxID=1310165 RepID=UPI003CF11548
MADQVTRNNHYVPVWYQRGFLKRAQSQLQYLDITPEQKALPDGRTISVQALPKWGTSISRCQMHRLYRAIADTALRIEEKEMIRQLSGLTAEH